MIAMHRDLHFPNWHGKVNLFFIFFCFVMSEIETVSKKKKMNLGESLNMPGDLR